jgi:hypothetical protein
MVITWPKGQQKRRYWRLGDDEYKVISGRVLLGEKVSILRYGFIGDTMFYDVQVIGGKKSALLNSNCVRNMAFIGLAAQPSLASCAYSSIAPVVPLPAATSHVVPPSPPPPSASNARSSGISLRSGQPLQPVIIKPRTSGTGPLPPPPSASVKNGGSPIIRKTGLRSGSGGSSTPMNHPKFGAPAAATDSAGFLLCAHKVRKLNCLLCKAGKTQDPKSGATVAAAVVQTRTLDITMATKSPAIATGPRPSSRSTSETVTSGPCEPAPRIPRIKEPPPLKVLPRL